LLGEKCVEDAAERLWDAQIVENLIQRMNKAMDEVSVLISEIQSQPINYNHYYTQTITSSRSDRMKDEVERCAQLSSQSATYVNQCKTVCIYTSTNIEQMVKMITTRHEADMEKWACNEALDCLLAIYKVSA